MVGPQTLNLCILVRIQAGQPFDSGSILRLRSVLTIAHGLRPIINKSNVSSEVETTAMPYFVYILRTSSNTLYIGQTNNLEKRLKEHLNKTSKSAKYIRYFSDLKLVYSEIYSTRKEAMQREAQLKLERRQMPLSL